MEDNKQDKAKTQTELNKEEIRRPTGHTWIGDRDEIRPDATVRPVTRATIADGEARPTRLVERQKRPYRGFITDEEVKHAEAAAEIDRMSRAESQAARDRMMQTRVYSGLGSGLDDEEEKEEKAPETARRTRRHITIRMDDEKKRKRLIALLAVFVMLLAFEISYFVMKAETASFPGKTEQLKAQTEAVTAENENIQGESEKLGDRDEIAANRDSWQKIRDQLAGSE